MAAFAIGPRTERSSRRSAGRFRDGGGVAFSSRRYPAPLASGALRVGSETLATQRGPGRPPLGDEIVELIVRLGRENRPLGMCSHSGRASRSRDPSLGKLDPPGASTPRSRTSTSERAYVEGVPRRPGERILATDFFVVDTSKFHPALCSVRHRDPEPHSHILGSPIIRPAPSSPRLPQPCRDLAEHGRSFRFLIRDRDAKFTASFDEVFASEDRGDQDTDPGTKGEGFASHCTSWVGWGVLCRRVVGHDMELAADRQG